MRHPLMPWTPFSYIVVNLARQIGQNEIVFSGVNSTLPMLACLLAKRAYDFSFTYINVAGGVDAATEEGAAFEQRPRASSRAQRRFLRIRFL